MHPQARGEQNVHIFVPLQQNWHVQRRVGTAYGAPLVELLADALAQRRRPPRRPISGQARPVLVEF